jgi:hypothetical protein
VPQTPRVGVAAPGAHSAGGGRLRRPAGHACSACDVAGRGLRSRASQRSAVQGRRVRPRGRAPRHPDCPFGTDAAGDAEPLEPGLHGHPQFLEQPAAGSDHQPGLRRAVDDLVDAHAAVQLRRLEPTGPGHGAVQRRRGQSPRPRPGTGRPADHRLSAGAGGQEPAVADRSRGRRPARADPARRAAPAPRRRHPQKRRPGPAWKWRARASAMPPSGWASPRPG